MQFSKVRLKIGLFYTLEISDHYLLINWIDYENFYPFFFTIILISSCSNQNNAISVSDAWMRPGIENRNSAAFITISNGTDKADTLISARSNLSKVVEIHETYEKENDMKGMRHIAQLIIPANSIVELKPGSFHIMLIGLNNNIRKGQSGKIELHFSTIGKKTIEVLAK